MKIYLVDLFREWSDGPDEEVYCKTMRIAKKEAKRMREQVVDNPLTSYNLLKDTKWTEWKLPKGYRPKDGDVLQYWKAKPKLLKKAVLIPDGGEVTVTIRSIPVKTEREIRIQSDFEIRRKQLHQYIMFKSKNRS